jgi:hypothetical protein
MKITDLIRIKIDRLPRGYVFTYEDFTQEVDSKEAVIKALNRMATEGSIAKLSKGKYYKPEKTPFGTLEPDQYQVVKDLLEKGDRVIGYLTGYSVYNQLGLTTQISNTIQIGRNDPRPALTRDRYKIKFIRQKNTITKDNISLLQLLDAIRYIRSIPDSSVSASCQRLLALIKQRTEADIASMVRLAQKYPPATRALLGALLQQISAQESPLLKQSLNPITTYDLGITANTLPTAPNWNIQ